jgi:quinoprotein glucose dehydrogenase
MSHTTLRGVAFACLCACSLGIQTAIAQHGATAGEWRHYGGDAGGTKYSPLDQIDASNVKQLQIAWRWKSENFGPRPDFNWEVTPVMAGGILYFTAGTSRVAYDVRSGKLLWTFHTVPRGNEYGNDSWLDDSWQYTGNTAVWAPISADLELGYVYLPVETPTGDFYGGHRPGDNLFADSIVCLDAKTGRRIWHYQLIHHDIWDWDTASAPVLLDVTVSGKPMKVVAQVTKQGFTYVFDRVTGEPVWPIVERPVPQSDVPGERTSATQPFPTKPAPFDRQGVTEDDLIDFTPALKAEALRIASQFKLGPLYSPPIVQGSGGKLGTLTVPHNQGAANWQSAAADPETGLLYVPSVTNWWASALVEGGDRSNMRYIGRNTRVEPPLGLPIIKPPWGRITAIDLNTGEHAWMVPNGHAPEYVLKHPALAGIDLSEAGNPERAPLLVTRTLLFSGDGAGLFSSGPQGGGRKFRALDKKTGLTIYEMELPANETGLPMTYMAGGRQFIVVAVGAAGFPAELVALALRTPAR